MRFYFQQGEGKGVRYVEAPPAMIVAAAIGVLIESGLQVEAAALNEALIARAVSQFPTAPEPLHEAATDVE